MVKRLFCEQPDRDAPKMKCGYPLPCPFHTVVIEEQKLTVPHGSSAATSATARRRLKELQHIVFDKDKPK